MSTNANLRQVSVRATAILLGLALLCLGLGGAMVPRAEQLFMERTQDANTATLRVVADGLDQSIARFAPLPAMISERASLLQALEEPGNAGLIPYVNEQLRLTAAAVGASDIYLLDATGLTVAASNYRKPATFIGRRFEFRPYFLDALQGENAFFHALGTTSGERGFFFAAPVLNGIEVRGVLAVKMVVDPFEARWSQLPQDIAVADPDGVIFLSSRPDWQLRTLTTLTPETVERIRSTQQYPLDQLEPFAAATRLAGRDGVEMEVPEDGGALAYAVASVPMALPGWHAIVFSPFAAARQSALNMLALWGLAVTVVSLLAYVALQRQARRAERVAIQQAERALLEARVEARTADLKFEIEERRAAETRLRQTQTELVQAGKLAALGQMSAALSHEINQPLSAVLSYADNAAAYLDQNRIDEARGNILRISDMADRMARISGHLRNFARRPGDALKPIVLADVISEAIALAEPQLKQCGAKIRFASPGPDAVAIGGPLRLQQVLLNLITNALDAMAETATPVIEISVADAADHLRIVVRDHGPGLAAEMTERAFEPFVSGKKTGEGLGLGLSISHNIITDFGGQITAANHPEGGAVFDVMLRRADNMALAGQ